MHVWGDETVEPKKSCMAALPSMRMMLLAKPFVWTCQSEHAVCVYHADTRILAVRTMYQLSVGGLWVINHHKLGHTQERPSLSNVLHSDDPGIICTWTLGMLCYTLCSRECATFAWLG